MLDQLIAFAQALESQTGLSHFWWGNAVMIAIGATMIYLAVSKKYEPLLLVGIGFSCIIANVPGSDLILPGGLFNYAYQGVALLIIPPLIFFGVGAMTDFGPMIANPKLVILGAAAHLGIFVALILAKLLGFTLAEAGAIGIIGGADGPMAIFVTMKLAPHLLPQVSVAAYSYMALMPLIQPPVMRLLTTRKERLITMRQSRPVSRLEKIAFPIVIGIVVNLFLPPVAPLITMLMLGNLFREVLVVDRLVKTAANDLMNVIIIILTVAIGSTMNADSFLTIQTVQIVVLGLVAFIFGTASGVIGAKIMNLFLKEKINPLLGSAGIASVPIAARVSHIVALRENPTNYLIYHAMGPNLAGVFGTAISGGIMLALIGVK
ncbi:glutaconyl-CoA decarboxylase [Rhodospirillum rubrum F11]|uniref:oxaloacetate decarboxylase (Na(+) extruding) n=1 Tax=Rhodospirillum rubrum (strain ATCC 11170 / ATH 1.1.1 / DSM 467 / LMG 4362 / NCIMB 8255 / S1) TaxID=269796 RepID=Q2RN28_RHORT|nr:sodium ion-translocating decarboxylase subunit beta [Rhodospirillum rubrum]ABC24467.1 Glutaconyl-CoA decarboxylase [Rhodospirillum rubrum ATCC 11170]AEO50218.1 glutaconyl-CoA decarboxylase [Rhodospirillum rubrum F11]MBK5956193.1 glutaconyl-CoA decarboxylase [Rhodospirillum rubrum]QXG80386.1 sodium ion-translocating decarboxylase subunit beta [Rhodospirillum rubrum]